MKNCSLQRHEKDLEITNLSYIHYVKKLLVSLHFFAVYSRISVDIGWLMKGAANENSSILPCIN